MVEVPTYSKTVTQETDKLHRTYLDNLLNKPGPASDPDWVPGPETINALESSKVLLVRIQVCSHRLYTNMLQGYVYIRRSFKILL